MLKFRKRQELSPIKDVERVHQKEIIEGFLEQFILEDEDFGEVDLLGPDHDKVTIDRWAKTRRQRVLMNISFESTPHNIYDPMYTSEEEEKEEDSI